MISVLIPTYNESKNILEIIRRIQTVFEQAGEADYEILVMDDDSPDGTAGIVNALGELRVRAVNRRGKPRGLSSAIIDGFAEAKGDICGVIDADMSHPPEAIPKLVEAVRRGSLIAVGSRYIKGGGVVDWPWSRRFISRASALMARCVTSIHDGGSGFFFIRKSLLDGLALDPVGFKIGLEIFVRAHHQGRIEEVPYIFTDRVQGKSKFGFFVTFCYLKQITKLLFRKRS